MTSVAVPEIDQQTRDQLTPGCEADDCDGCASWIGTWGRCAHGMNLLLLCSPHKARALELKSEDCIWECLHGSCIVALLSVVPL